MNQSGTDNQTIRYDSTAEGLGDNDRHAVQTYVSDMLALERHIGQAISAQDKIDDPSLGSATGVIAQLKALNVSHTTALEQHLKALGGHEASAIKSAWSALLGIGAEAINSARKTKLTKALRDDYTALNLAAMGYTLLFATGIGLGDQTTADLAKRHLSDYARLVMLINEVIPGVVLAELAEDGETVAIGADERIRREINELWRRQSDVAH